MSRAGWGSKGQQRESDAIKNQLNRVIKVGRMQPVPLTGLTASSSLKTRGAQVGFQVTSLQGVDSFVLMRNFSRDPGSAQVIHTWPASSLVATPQTFPLSLQYTDADPAIAGQKAFYWIKAVPVSNQTGGNTFLSGPQEFDASNFPVAQAITGDYAVTQAYTPTTQPLSSATGVGVNQATIAIASFQIQYPFDINNDGVPDLVSYSSASLGPLLDATTYFVYFDDPTYAGGPQTYIASVNNPDVSAGLHRQYIGMITTPAHGGGGTTGRGGGGGACFSGNTEVVTKRGRLPISAVVKGDRVMTRRGWRRVGKLLIHDWDGEMRDMGYGLVTPEHQMHPDSWAEKSWIAARELFPKAVQFKGKVFNLEVIANSGLDDVHCYQLASGWFAHNFLKA